MKKINITIIFCAVIMILCSCKNDTENKKAEWIKNAFASLQSNHYPKVKAISWWHENFDNSLLKINSSKESLEAYRKGVSSSIFITVANFNSNKLIEPTVGIYHSAYPDFGGTEDIVTAERIRDFETLANKKIVWAYFSIIGMIIFNSLQQK